MLGCFIGSLLEFGRERFCVGLFAGFQKLLQLLGQVFYVCLEARVTRRAALVLAQVFFSSVLIRHRGMKRRIPEYPQIRQFS